MLTGRWAFMVLLGVVFFAFAGIAEAQIITNVTASASTESPNRDASHAVGQSALRVGDNLALTPDQTHSTGADGEVCMTTAGDRSYFCVTRTPNVTPRNSNKDN